MENAQSRYAKKTLVPVRFCLNRNTEPELVEWYANVRETGNVAGYMKDLLRRDMEAKNGNQKPDSGSD